MIRKRNGRKEWGAQLVELAFVLPLLAVIVAGAADFGQAWNARQILANAARDGARLGGNQFKLDLTDSPPPSIVDICEQVADYLIQENINPSFMGVSAMNASAVSTACASPATVASTNGTTTPAAFTYYTTGQNKQTYGLEIQPDIGVPPVSGEACSSTVACVDSTEVTLTYPYNWSFGFNHVIEMFGAPSTYASMITLQADATMPNIAD